MDIIVARQRDICPLCGGDIYQARMKLADPASMGKEWKWVRGYECLCGRYVKDRDGNRYYVERLEDKDSVELTRQVAELIQGTSSPEEANERLMREAEKG